MNPIEKLFSTASGRLAYLLRILPLTLLPPFAIVWLLDLLVGLPEFPTSRHSPVRNLLMTVIVAPLMETSLLVSVIEIVRLCSIRVSLLIGFSTCLWAAFHSAVVPLWGIAVAWPFLIQNVTYFRWEESGKFQASMMVFLLHAASNLVLVGIRWIGEGRV